MNMLPLTKIRKGLNYRFQPMLRWFVSIALPRVFVGWRCWWGEDMWAVLPGPKLRLANCQGSSEGGHFAVTKLVADSATCNGASPVIARAVANNVQKLKIWIDLDNTPHVPFFEPIIEELEARGFRLLITARDAFQVYELAEKKRLQVTKVGRHYVKNRLRKIAGLAYRALQLAPIVLRERPALAVSHGSRSQIMLCNCLKIPTVLIEDYEFCKFPPLMRPDWTLAPSVIPNAALPCANDRIRKYTGIKENTYVWKLIPDPRILNELGLVEAEVVATVRPPATEAHYHDCESEKLFEAFMERACLTPNVKVVLLPRNQRQAESIRLQWPGWFLKGKTVIPGKAVDGLNLIWHSDLVVSGGGTMNREAAALDVPVYTIFRGTIGAVDRLLRADGRLVLIESAADVLHKIRLVKRSRGSVAQVASRQTLLEIVDTLQEIAKRATS